MPPASEAALRDMLERIVNRATRPTKTDSCGQPMVSIRAALLDHARELLEQGKA